MVYEVGRYGTDNSFIVIGDGKHLLQSQKDSTAFDIRFASLSINYQLTMKAYNILFDRLSVVGSLNFSRALSEHNFELKGIDDTKIVSSRDFFGAFSQISVAVPF